MYRFLLRPMWLLFHMLVVGAIVLMATLGAWQFRRLDERKDFNRTVIERSQQPPVPVEALLADLESKSLDPAAAEWRVVSASGSYLPDQLVEFNQSQSGRAGENVLSALALDDGTTLIVNRGFIPLDDDVAPAAPAVRVDVVGYIRPSETRGRGGLTDAPDAGALTEVRRIDIPLISAHLPGDVAPVYLQLTSADPEITAADPSPVALPELDNGPHLSYAIQWLVFAICVAIGWVLAVRRSLAQRRREVQSGAITNSGARGATAQADST